MAQDSKACLTLPPVVTTDYKPKGQYEDIAGFKTYITGSQGSARGLVDLYDIFGFQQQTLQGADLLAASLQALVVMPDLFQGHAMDPGLYPPDTEEKQQRVKSFQETKMWSPDHYPNLLRFTAEAQHRWAGVKAWGMVGFCWGGKLAVEASGKDTPFKASGQAHPAKLERADAEAVTIPHICLASHDEPAEIVEEYAEIFKAGGKPGQVETYDTMFHGWMGARARLHEEENAKEYERGYSQLAAFFAKQL